MPTYPSLPVGITSRATASRGRQVDRASNGRARLRVLYAAQRKQFAVVHPALNATDRATLDTFVSTYGSGEFSFRWPFDGVTYTVILADDPSYASLGAGLVSASVTLVEA